VLDDGQLHDLSFANPFGDRRAVSVEHLRRRFDLHRFGETAHPHDGVGSNHLVRRDFNPGCGECLEAGERDRDVVLPNGDEGNVIRAVGVGDSLVSTLCPDIHRDNLSAGHHEAGSVRDRANQRSLIRQLRPGTA
jgi:hypothetical protein